MSIPIDVRVIPADEDGIERATGGAWALRAGHFITRTEFNADSATMTVWVESRERAGALGWADSEPVEQ